MTTPAPIGPWRYKCKALSARGLRGRTRESAHRVASTSTVRVHNTRRLHRHHWRNTAVRAHRKPTAPLKQPSAWNSSKGGICTATPQPRCTPQPSCNWPAARCESRPTHERRQGRATVMCHAWRTPMTPAVLKTSRRPPACLCCSQVECHERPS